MGAQEPLKRPFCCAGDWKLWEMFPCCLARGRFKPVFGSTDFIKSLENSALTPESLRGWTQPNALIFSFACQGVLLAVTAPFHTAPGALRLGFVNHLVCIRFRLPRAHIYSAHKIWTNMWQIVTTVDTNTRGSITIITTTLTVFCIYLSDKPVTAECL